LNGIQYAAELGKQVVSGRIDHSAAMLLNKVEKSLLVGLQGGDCFPLVILHKSAVTGDVGTGDGGEFAMEAFRFYADTSLSRSLTE
jgi:hypothetical protein